MHIIAEAEVQRRLVPVTFPIRQQEENERYLQRRRTTFAVKLEQVQAQGKAEQQRIQEILEKAKYKTTSKGDFER